MTKKSKKATPFSDAASSTMEQISGKVSAFASSLGEQPSTKQVMESAQQIWLAGLGAFAKAKTEGSKVFETLVKQGEQIDKNTRTVAEATIETAKEQASKTISMATDKFDKLEQVFEDRVHKSLNRLGVLTRKDMEALSAQVAGLTAAVNALLAKEKRGTKPAGAKKPAPKTAVAKKLATKKPVGKRPIVKKPTAKKATRRA